MADDQSKQDGRDRVRVTGGQNYQVDYLVAKTGITKAEAIELILRHGSDRETLEREAAALKKTGLA